MSTRHLSGFGAAILSLAVTSIAIGADAVSWRNNLDAAKIEATQSGKLVLLHFYTSTCGPCRMLDENVFSQPQIGDDIERNYVPVKLNAEESRALASAYRIERVPSEIVLTPQGNVVACLSCPQNPGEYASQLANLADHYRQQTLGRESNQAPVQAAYAGLQVGQYANQPTVPVQQVSPQQPIAQQPSVTNNPYTNQAPVANTAYGQPVSAPNVPLMPANAMPNSYRQQTATPTQQQYAVQSAAAVAQPVQQQAISNPAASQVNPASHMSVARQLPAGSPPLAFDGYCPVALKSARKWVAGDLKFGAIHRGRTFLFMGEEQRQQFLANPDAYCPVFSGMDPVLLLDDNQLTEGTRRYGFEYRGAFYLFANQESMNRFKSQPDHYAANVRQAMNRMDQGETILR